MRSILLLVFLSITTLANAQKFLNPEPIFSKFLNEKRSYLVALPNSYSDTIHSLKKYPVILLLDGHYHYWYSYSTIDFLSRNEIIPECIVVSVINTNRTRDLTPTHSTTYYDGTKNEDLLKSSGGGENFLKFINQELIPTIDENYNTLDLKVFVGHSFGGLTVAQSFISNSSPFKAYISMDPSIWWDGELCISQLDSVKSLSKTKSWFMSAANNNEFKQDTTQTRNAQVKFDSLLHSKIDSTRTKLQFYENDNHQSVTLISLYDGIRFTFESFRLTLDVTKDLDSFKRHFKHLSAEWDIEFNPSEALIDKGINHFMRLEQYDTALDFCKFNIELYPESFHVYHSLAMYYQKMGKKQLAIKNYRKSIELNPNNLKAIEILRSLE